MRPLEPIVEQAQKAETAMTGTKKSRAEYFRDRRKKVANRLEEATRDADRKRDKRGGYKNLNKQYEIMIASLPEHLQFPAWLLCEYSQDWSLRPGSLTPLPMVNGEMVEQIMPARDGILPFAKDAFSAEPLSLTVNARERRREELQAYCDRNIVNAVESMSESDLEMWVASRFPGLDPEPILARIKAQYDEASMRLKGRREKNAEKQARFRQENIEKVRAVEGAKTKTRREKEKAAKETAPFVAIDAEGCNLGAPFVVESSDEILSLDLGLPEHPSEDRRLKGQDHRTFLWGASGDGGHIDWLGGNDKTPLPTKAICEWLVSLPKKFPRAIFVMFAAGYDWTQVFRDLDYETAWELWNGLPWSEHDNPTGMKPNRRRWVFWREFALRVYPGKYLEIAKFKDPNRIKNEKGEFDFGSKIKIYDTFGFFQSSFIKAATGFGGDFLSAEEREILQSGKSRRNEFDKIPLAQIMKYTPVELRVLARMIQNIRDGLKAFELTLRDWHGAGCIAQTMMRKNRITDFYPEIAAAIDVNDMTQPLAWSLRAYFGSRVEMVKQGVHNSKFWNYDISSAYPNILRQLRNMRNGNWRTHSAVELLTPDVGNDFHAIPHPEPDKLHKELNLIPMSKYMRSQEQLQQLLDKLEGFSLVSMVRVRFYFPRCHRRVFSSGKWIISKADIPWFPLPIRAGDGSIYFPCYGEGIYMVEEVRAMLRWAIRIYAHAEPDERPAIALLEAREFLPVNDAKPFKTLVEKSFGERAKIVEATNEKQTAWEADGKQGPEPYDVREKVLKLGLNSLYGKTAQSKGGRVKRDGEGDMRAFPPKEANPYYAAAVTAGARAMLLDAASADPDAIILFATDGICSTRELPGLEIPEKKTLGMWEASLRQNGVFVKAGIYTHEPYQETASDDYGADKQAGKPVKRATKMRGIRPASLPQGVTAEQWLIEKVPQAWERDDVSLEFPYRAYKTFGAALASRKSWELAGHWIEGTRQADIQRVSAKRDCRGVARVKMQDGSERRGERRRAYALFDTAPAENPIGWELSRPYTPEWIDGELAKRVQAEEERKTLECKGGFGGDE
jgi:hypothetical protein